MVFEKGHIPWMKGKKHTEEAKRRLSVARLEGIRSGRIKSWNEGTKGLIKAWNKGLTKETDKRMNEISKK